MLTYAESLAVVEARRAAARFARPSSDRGAAALEPTGGSR
jgi:hypothetical protein